MKLLADHYTSLVRRHGRLHLDDIQLSVICRSTAFAVRFEHVQWQGRAPTWTREAIMESHYQQRLEGEDRELRETGVTCFHEQKQWWCFTRSLVLPGGSTFNNVKNWMCELDGSGLVSFAREKLHSLWLPATGRGMMLSRCYIDAQIGDQLWTIEGQIIKPLCHHKWLCAFLLILMSGGTPFLVLLRRC